MTTTFTIAESTFGTDGPPERDSDGPAVGPAHRPPCELSLAQPSLQPGDAARRRRNPRADLAEGVISTAIAAHR